MIELNNIIKIYGTQENKVEALKNVSINFREKELVSILGPSGCGKTTLLNILGGLDKYTDGDLIINDKSTKDFKDRDWDTYRNRRVGFVFQNYNLIPHLSVLGNVELALTLSGISKEERKIKAKKALEVVGLLDQIKKRPNQLSGGQMQRVAIARAIVNNPDIILADEPTGALDSATSVQIMEILKQLSNERLVVMVTHNKDLALKYSTRIIELLDGKVIGDSLPYDNVKKVSFDEKDGNIKTDIIKQACVDDIDNNSDVVVNEHNEIVKKSKNDKQNNKNEKHKKPKNKDKVRKSSMSFWTAYKLSFKNLFSKKTRTMLTSFAGSIGIIGVALVLAVSNGFTNYIGNMQSNSLSGYPITINTVSANLESVQDSFYGKPQAEEYPDDNKIHINNPMINASQKIAEYNFISKEFVEYIEKFEKEQGEKYMNEINYSYSSPFTVITKNGENYSKVNTNISSSAIGTVQFNNFFEGLENEDFIRGQYDVIYGKYPVNANEVALVVNSRNQMSKELLSDLGIPYQKNADGTYKDIEFKDLITTDEHIGKEYKVIYNDYYYIPQYNGSEITGFIENTNYEEMFNYDDEKSITLKISGVLRVNKDSPLSIYGSGIMYTPKLTEKFRENAKQSLIVKTQKQTKDKFYFPYVLNLKEVGTAIVATSPKDLQDKFKEYFKGDVSVETAIEYSLQRYGASEIPNSISFYPKDFKTKDKIINYINAWNEDSNNVNNKIYFSDPTSFLSNTLGETVNIISYVLIAFASISLVVSSIMIGIITYVSVVERTKEIGVLRSIGARKKDIRRVFNAETLIIGFSAGTIGVLFSLLISIPFNVLLKNLTGGITGLFSLSLLNAIVLIFISMILTLISGLIPAQIASKKDPVVALRSE